MFDPLTDSEQGSAAVTNTGLDAGKGEESARTVPVPSDAPEPDWSVLSSSGQPSKVWDYRDAEGQCSFLVARWEMPGSSGAKPGGSRGQDVDDGHANEAAGLDMADPVLRRTILLARQLIGMPRHFGQHVGGFILTERPLTETVPIGNGAMAERSFIEWDKDDIDALGILKIDILALGMLTCIRKCFDLIEAHHGQAHTLTSIPQEDSRVYDMLCRGDSAGVFQVESRAQMNMLPRLRPRRFYDLVIEVAIVRRGPIQGDMVHPYLRRRSGEEPVDYPSPEPPHDPLELKNILGRTLGVPIFQERR